MNRELSFAAGLSLLLHALLLAGMTRMPWSLASPRSPSPDLGIVHVVLLAPQSPSVEADRPLVVQPGPEADPVPSPRLDPPAVPSEVEPPTPPKAEPVIRPPAKPKRTPARPKKEVVLAREARPVIPPAHGHPPPISEAIQEVAPQPAETQALVVAGSTTGGSMAKGGAVGTGTFVASLHRGGEGSTGVAEREAIPRYDVNPRPPYPETARRRGLEGTALLSVLVRSDGTVGEVKLAKTSGHGLLDAAAMEAVRDWQFIPGRRGERPVETEIRVPVRFQLQ